jgi:hypothetical protein
MTSLAWQESLFIRATSVAALLWIAKWFSRNYAQAQAEWKKFDRINRLLGQGVPTIVKLVESNDEAKADVYRNLVSLMLEMTGQDATDLKEPEHVMEAIGKAIKLSRSA